MRWNARWAGATGLTLAVVAGLTVAPAAPAVAESNGGVRVMPLGDSITDGNNVPGGYRIGLWQRFATGGYTVDFVGSGFNGPASLGDHDHEGHSGWRIDQLDANIVAWLRSSAPRTILLHIGTNDMNQNYDVANAPARLSALIDHIRTLAPSAELFVAQITPVGDPTVETRVRTFNAAIPGVVAQKGPMTHVVDMHSAISTADLADGLRPDAGGYDKMAAAWFTALRSVPGALNPVAVPPVGAAVLLSHRGSNRCMDVSGAATTAGTQVLIWDCHGAT
jgi:lysophospholipase L1-like esterase